MRGSRPITAALPGIILILLGAWFLLRHLGVAMPGLGQLWPMFLVLGGLWLLASYLLDDHDTGSVFVGAASLLAGLFFLLYTFRVVAYLEPWWPVFPMIVGISVLAQWAASEFKGIGSLWIGLLALLFGAFALPFALGMITMESGRQMVRWWPVILILVGVLALLQVGWRVDRH